MQTTLSLWKASTILFWYEYPRHPMMTPYINVIRCVKTLHLTVRID
ncbi:MAG: hypothetical protein AAGG48_23450 [Planctomycetota bacterium]